MKTWKRIVSLVVAFVLLVSGIQIASGTAKASNATDVTITSVSDLEQHSASQVRLRLATSETFSTSGIVSGLGGLVTLSGMGDAFNPTDYYGYVTEGEAQVLLIFDGVSISDISSVPEGAKIAIASGTFTLGGSTYKIPSESSMTYRDGAWKEETDLSITSVSSFEAHGDSAVRLRLATSETFSADGAVALSNVVQLSGMGETFNPTGSYGWVTSGESQLLLIYEGVTYAQIASNLEGAKITVNTGTITVGNKSYYIAEGFSMTYQNGEWVKDVEAKEVAITSVSQPVTHGSGIRFELAISETLPENVYPGGIMSLAEFSGMGDGFAYTDSYGYSIGNALWLIYEGVTSNEIASVPDGAKLTFSAGTITINEEPYEITTDFTLTYSQSDNEWQVNLEGEGNEEVEVLITDVSGPTTHGSGIRFELAISETLPENVYPGGIMSLAEFSGMGDGFAYTDSYGYSIGNALWLIYEGVTSNEMAAIPDGATLTFTAGEITVGEESYKITTNFILTFNKNSGKWVSNIPQEDDEDESKYKPANVTVYDLYELEGLSSLTIPENESLYGLTDLKQQSNVGLRMKIDDLRGEACFGLAKTVANNAWAPYGYVITLGANGSKLKLLTAEYDGTNLTYPTRTEANALEKDSFILEFGVVDLYPADGGNDVVARRVYVKIDEAEVLSWIDTDMNRTLGSYVPAWAQYETVVSSVDYEGYELRTTTPSVQDISEINSGLAKFTSIPTRETLVGQAKNATNNAIRMQVKFSEQIDSETDELMINFSNDSKLSVWDGEKRGYIVSFGYGMITVAHANDFDNTMTRVFYDYPKDEFLLEIGTYDQDVYKDGEKVNGYSRNVYVKIDGEVVVTMVDKKMDREFGNNVWVYSSANVVADLVSLTSDRYLIRETPVVQDLFDVTKLSKVELTPTKEEGLGVLPASTNVALRTKVTASSNCEGLFFAFAKTTKDKFWDADESGWEFWIRPASGTIYINNTGANSQAFCGMDIPEEFILEIGERDVRYNDGEAFGRELYVAIDGVEVLRHVDKDYTRKLGNYVATYMSPANATVVLESLTTTGYIPVEKSIAATDIYDISGYASKKLNKYVNYLGELSSTKNSAVKMKVNVNPDGDLFGICFGKTVKDQTTEDTVDANVSGWNIWFWPEYDHVVIEYGYYKTGTTFGYDFPASTQSFELEVGSKDVYYENGKHYGYEVYVKIDGVMIGSWIDEGIANRKVGTHVLGYTNPKTNCVISTLYPTTTLPVEYIVNGEVSDPVDAIAAETQVVVKKPSKITITTNTAETYSLKGEGVFLNEDQLTSIEAENVAKNAEVFEVTAGSGDKIVLKLQKKELTVDEPVAIMDLYDVSGQEKLTVQGLANGGVGNMIQDGERKRTNSAFRFKATIPESGSIRWGMYSDMSTSWGYNAFIARISAGQVGLYNMIYSEKNLVQNNAIEAGKTYYVECGMVKCYEEGNYKYNRWYIKMGESLDKLEQVCWYDSRERASYGSTVSFIGQDFEETFTVYSTYDVKTITDTSTQANKDKIETYTVYRKERMSLFYPESVVAYTDASKAKEPAAIKLCPKEGMKLTSLIVSGVNVIDSVVVTETGEYVYELPSVTRDITFSYIIK